MVSFVAAAGWLTGTSLDGLRKCLADEFSILYVFHLRGNARTSGEKRRKEKDNVFESGSRSPIAITLMVKNPEAKAHGQIYFHDIGDYLTLNEKLSIISGFKSINGITAANGWKSITPDKHNDWLDQRDDSFDAFINIGEKGKSKSTNIFAELSSGIKTNRDPWCYNASKHFVSNNMERMISFYNDELNKYHAKYKDINSLPKPEDVVDKSLEKIKWTREVFTSLRAKRVGIFDTSHIVQSIYRPFSKEWAYFDRHFNNCVYQMPKIFPLLEVENLVIAVTGSGAGVNFSALMTDTLPNLHFQSTSQCFPLKLYEEHPASTGDDLFASQDTQTGYTIKDGITDAGLAHFKAAYTGEAISKEDIFHYIYGLLHSPDYRTRYADNLSKQLPRIPCVKTAADFWAFVKAGRKLGALHVDYETVKPYPVTIEGKPKADTDYYVTKMKFGKKGKEKDKTTVIYNDHITIKNIPLEAYKYIVNGKAALDWVMDRQCLKTDKKSGIVNDANDYAIETLGNAKYPLELFQRVITVSLETMKIVTALPKLDIG